MYAGQQLMYAMADGTFGAPREDGSNDPERTILGVLLANHKTQFYIVRTAFLGGIASMMGAIGVRAWASYDPPLAIAVTLVFCGAILAIVASNRDTTRVFERVRLLDERVVSVRESFEEADENGDGLLSVGELQRALARCGADVSAEEVEALLRAATWHAARRRRSTLRASRRSSDCSARAGWRTAAWSLTGHLSLAEYYTLISYGVWGRAHASPRSFDHVVNRFSPSRAAPSLYSPSSDSAGRSASKRASAVS